jgi:hypothetical protein
MNRLATRTQPNYVAYRRLIRVGDWVMAACWLSVLGWLPLAMTYLAPAGALAQLLVVGVVPLGLLVGGVLISCTLSTLAARFLTFDRRDLDTLAYNEVTAVTYQMWRHYGGRYSPSEYELPARFWLARRQLWLPYEDQPADTDGVAPWGESW